MEEVKTKLVTQENEKYYDVIVRLAEGSKEKSLGELQTDLKLDSDCKYIRIWKLGDAGHRLFPTSAAFEKLSKTIKEWDGKSTIDIVWGCDLTVEVHELY